MALISFNFCLSRNGGSNPTPIPSTLCGPPFPVVSNGDCAGWGGQSGAWVNVNFDLSDYAGQDAVVRFALYSDPSYSALDDALLTGFQVDNIAISGSGNLAFSDDADGRG